MKIIKKCDRREHFSIIFIKIFIFYKKCSFRLHFLIFFINIFIFYNIMNYEVWIHAGNYGIIGARPGLCQHHMRLRFD